jgi:DNA-binding MarR family transcriptional regulator
MKQITGAGHYGFLIEVTSKKIKKTLQREFTSQGLDLTVDQWVVLDYLRKHDGISQNILAEKIFKDAPTLTRIVDLLAKKELIQRNSDDQDRRKFKLFLKEAGHEMIKKALPIVLETRTNGWEGLSTADYEELVRILTIVNRNFENEPFFENVLEG